MKRHLDKRYAKDDGGGGENGDVLVGGDGAWVREVDRQIHAMDHSMRVCMSVGF
jgi:hypothetical protein